jgi:hypothetical protein
MRLNIGPKIQTSNELPPTTTPPTLEQPKPAQPSSTTSDHDSSSTPSSLGSKSSTETHLRLQHQSAQKLRASQDQNKILIERITELENANKRMVELELENKRMIELENENITLKRARSILTSDILTLQEDLTSVTNALQHTLSRNSSISLLQLQMPHDQQPPYHNPLLHPRPPPMPQFIPPSPIPVMANLSPARPPVKPHLDKQHRGAKTSSHAPQFNT